MEPRGLVGMFGYQVFSTKLDRFGHGTPESLEATYMRVLSEVGSHYHLVQHDDEDFARITANDELARYRWWEDHSSAVAAFEAQKARALANKK